jgi:succinoglycan biosynthesis transport protein ExoP
MLKTNNSGRSPHSDSEEGTASLSELVDYLFAILRQQFALILPVAVCVFALGALYVYVTPPAFTARATMIIDRGKSQVQLGGTLNEMPLDLVGVDSQIQLIKSETLALAVIKKLDLTNDPEFVGPPKGVRSWFSALHSQESVASDRTRAVLASLVEHLKVDKTGYVIEIEFSSEKPERAAKIANAFAETYIEDRSKFKNEATVEAGAWLKDRLRDLRDKSVQADEAVVEFKRRNNIVAADGRLVNDQEITQLNSQLILAREKTAETRAKLDRVDAVVSAEISDRLTVGAVSDTLNNPVIVKLRIEYLQLASREEDWTRQYGADHRAVIDLGRQLRQVRRSINDELRRVAETYKSEYEIAKQRQGELELAVARAVTQSQSTNQTLTELRQLESTAETYRTLYKATLQRNMELVQQQTFPGTEARLITRASPPTSKSGPKTLAILGASAIGGMLLGFGAGAFRALRERVFRTQAHVETVLQAKCLALAPLVKPDRSYQPRPQPRSRKIVRDTVIWEVVDQPLSRLAEAMRSIKSTLDLSGPDKPNKILGFTSSLPKEGKSTLAAAFALLTAQSGSRSILVDCDFRNPALSAKLAPGAESGLAEVVSGKKVLEDVLWTEAATNFAFLPAVIKHRAAESSSVLASPALRAFFARLRRDYDYVIADFSPIAPIIDVQLTGGLVDSYIFVVEWGRTKIDVAELALNRATMVQENLLGIVLNKINFKTLSRYEGHRRDYYADESYAPYGQV